MVKFYMGNIIYQKIFRQNLFYLERFRFGTGASRMCGAEVCSLEVECSLCVSEVEEREVRECAVPGRFSPVVSSPSEPVPSFDVVASASW